MTWRRWLVVCGLGLSLGCFLAVWLGRPVGAQEDPTTTTSSTTTEVGSTTTSEPYAPTLPDCGYFGTVIRDLIAGEDPGLSPEFLSWLSGAAPGEAKACLQMAQMTAMAVSVDNVGFQVEQVEAAIEEQGPNGGSGSSAIPAALQDALVATCGLLVMVAAVVWVRGWRK